MEIQRYVGRFFTTVGFWADMDNPYVTYHDNYIESEWWALKEIWKKIFFIKDLKLFLTVQDVELLYQS
jgi:isoleucyl-tRNA synthetase